MFTLLDTNIAVGKPTRLHPSTVYVFNDKSVDEDGNSCAPVSSQNPTYWAMDLGSSVAIEGVSARLDYGYGVYAHGVVMWQYKNVQYKTISYPLTHPGRVAHISIDVLTHWGREKIAAIF